MNQNMIEKVLTEHINEKKTVFVFPTQTAADLWADRIISVSTVTAVAMERFIAWDDFKGTSIKSQHQNKTSVPSTMRKMFASQIISENKEKLFFKNLIVPEYAKNATGFTSWISSLLPSLALWKKYFEKSGTAPDDEDKDLQTLYEKYESFLNEHNLFDPAWEVPPFKSDGYHYIIFFPEILSDYSEYKTILEQSPEDITVIHLPQTENETQSETGTVNFFSNSRTEIKNAALYIRRLHEEKNIPWSEIAVNIPDMDSYGPYVERDFSLYEIPFVMRYAKPLSSTEAGSLFTQLQSCVTDNFSYESIKTLFLNTEIPWIKNSLNKQLLEFGKTNNCICAFEYKDEQIDVWEKSFESTRTSEDLKNFYHRFKRESKSFVESKTFSELRENYFQFRNDFFDMKQCTPKTDRILSRCISELGALIDLENKYPECRAPSAYSFFVSILDETNYLEQTNERGVQLLPYKLGSCAPFKCHIILDSSQASLAVIYKQFAFLREDKRELLLSKGKKVEDTNVTEQFIQLYKMNSVDADVYYSASSKTFTGYAQASSYLTENDLTKTEHSLESFLNDSYAVEKKCYLNGQNIQFTTPLYGIQKKSFEQWTKNHSGLTQVPQLNQAAVDEIENCIKKKRYENGKLKVSVSQLKNFLNCPRYWLVRNMIKLEQVNNDASLMDEISIGNLYHKILEIFCRTLKEENLPLKTENQILPEQYHDILEQSIDAAIVEEKSCYLTGELLNATRPAFAENVMEFVTDFSSKFQEYRVVDVEKEFSYEIPGKDILCIGKADCILQEPASAETILIDFKSSSYSVPSNSVYDEDDPETLPDFQMAMYVYLMQNQKKAITTDKACFYNIHDKKLVDVELTGFEKTIDKLLEVIDDYAMHVQTNDFVLNSEYSFDICSSCDYSAVCRKVFTVGHLE